nr:hypothetical protein [Tanacetum cinerariifolium]
VFETYQNVKQEIRDQLNAEAEAVQIILTGIDNDIYSTIDASPNACEMWKAIERLKQDTMADMNIPADDAPAKQAPAIAPPTRTDDQILLSSNWVPIYKSNCVLDVQKSQRNPIFLIVVAILKNTNFFRAFTTSSTIPAIYIQQFWDTMCFNSSTGL